jgi:thiamine monophosphate kinase
LATVNPKDVSGLSAIKIGEVVAGDGKVLLDGKEIKRAGYQHF